MNEVERKTSKVRKSIPVGLKNAQPISDIAVRAEMSLKAVREAISELRRAGVPIIPASSGGFFVAEPYVEADIKEAKRFLVQQQGQAIERIKMCNALGNWIAENDHKEELKNE